ncbi:MAG: methylaspartate ammonia-lyase [Pirellulales bacterium]|nr:methylaspartate ammonia-lyase [Pirellulales bacterium]
MKIQRAIFAKGASAFFFDDQRAIRKGAAHDGFFYEGKCVTPGFTRIRMAGESISVMLLLDDGQIAVGDCAAIQYSGAGGRDPLFLADDYLPFLEKHLRPALEGREIESFRSMAAALCGGEIDGRHMHTALRYGVSQALLDARAKALHKLRCEVICEEYGLPINPEPVPIFGQSGDNRYENADKMILKRVDVLPHGLINNIEEKLGRDGGKLKEYIHWLKHRIDRYKPCDDYNPVLHIDVYGTIGMIFDNNPLKVAKYIDDLQSEACKYKLYIEGPVDMEGKPRQLEVFGKIKAELRRLGSPVKIVADEWCNTVEDVRDFIAADACHMVQIKTPVLGGVQETIESVLYCRAAGMEAYQGGSCNETDVSAQCCVHLAMATHPQQMLAKPGMGFDEGFATVKNEMQRIREVLKGLGIRD